MIQDECARFIEERGIDVDRLFTHRWTLDQAEEAYRLFDTQTTGKGVFLDVREAVADIYRRLGRDGLVTGAAGNVSVRDGADAMLVTGSGVAHDVADAACVVRVTLRGRGRAGRRARAVQRVADARGDLRGRPGGGARSCTRTQTPARRWPA